MVPIATAAGADNLGRAWHAAHSHSSRGRQFRPSLTCCPGAAPGLFPQLGRSARTRGSTQLGRQCGRRWLAHPCLQWALPTHAHIGASPCHPYPRPLTNREQKGRMALLQLVQAMITVTLIVDTSPHAAIPPSIPIHRQPASPCTYHAPTCPPCLPSSALPVQPSLL